MHSDSNPQALAEKLAGLLKQPVFFADVLEALRDYPYRAVLRAWSDLRMHQPLERDLHGRYWLAAQAAEKVTPDPI